MKLTELIKHLNEIYEENNKKDMEILLSNGWDKFTVDNSNDEECVSYTNHHYILYIEEI